MSTEGSHIQGNSVTMGTSNYRADRAGDDQAPQELEALGLLVVPGGWEFEPGYRLASTLLVQLQISASGVIATTHLETVEYGWGSTQDEALEDLMSSLVEYKESLEARRERLSETSLLDLDRLHRLVEKTN